MHGDTEPQQRPYAAPANIIAVLKRVRSRNLPERIDSDFLRLAEVPEASYRRVTVALRFLGLIDEGQRPTDTLKALAAARDEEYGNLLSTAIRDAYKEDFDRIDPAEDTHAKIVAAFQPYQPRSQTDRMVMLFLGLCREAGIPVSEAPRERKMKGTVRDPRSTRSSARTPERKPAAPATPRREVTPPPSAPTGLLFGVTDDDIALLGDEQFDQVWQALGVVARTRAQAHHQRAKEAPSTDSEKGDQDE
jgi:hypothetical protein